METAVKQLTHDGRGLVWSDVDVAPAQPDPIASVPNENGSYQLPLGGCNYLLKSVKRCTCLTLGNGSACIENDMREHIEWASVLADRHIVWVSSARRPVKGIAYQVSLFLNIVTPAGLEFLSPCRHELPWSAAERISEAFRRNHAPTIRLIGNSILSLTNPSQDIVATFTLSGRQIGTLEVFTFHPALKQTVSRIGLAFEGNRPIAFAHMQEHHSWFPILGPYGGIAHRFVRTLSAENRQTEDAELQPLLG